MSQCPGRRNLVSSWENGASAVGPYPAMRTCRERRKCRSWLRAPETDWVSRFADEVIAEAERRAPGKPVVVRVRPLALRPDPPGQPARGDDPAPGRRRDPAARARGAAPDLLGRLRPVPQGARRRRRRRRLLGRAHRQAADLGARAAAAAPHAELGRALQGRDGRRRWPSWASSTAASARPSSTPPGAYREQILHRDAQRGGIDAVLDQLPAPRRPPPAARSSSRSRSTRPSSRPPRAPARPPRTTAARAPAGYFPYKPYCGGCERDLTTVTAYDDETTELTYTCRVRPRRDRAAERVQPRQAGLEGRLADALGLRGRGLRAQRRRPPSPGSSFVVGGQIVERDLRRRAADRPDVRLRRHQRHGEDVVLARAACRRPADALEIMEAPLLRWLYARRRPNQSFKIAFDQEIQRLYDEWDALDAQGRRRHRAARRRRRAPACRPARPRVRCRRRRARCRTARSPPSWTSPPAHDEQTLRILSDLDPERPGAPRSTRSGRGWTAPSAGSPPRSRPSSAPSCATSRTPSCWSRWTTQAARVAAAAARRAGRRTGRSTG